MKYLVKKYTGVTDVHVLQNIGNEKDNGFKTVFSNPLENIMVFVDNNASKSISSKSYYIKFHSLNGYIYEIPNYSGHFIPI